MSENPINTGIDDYKYYQWYPNPPNPWVPSPNQPQPSTNPPGDVGIVKQLDLYREIVSLSSRIHQLELQIDKILKKFEEVKKEIKADVIETEKLIIKIKGKKIVIDEQMIEEILFGKMNKFKDLLGD